MVNYARARREEDPLYRSRQEKALTLKIKADPAKLAARQESNSRKWAKRKAEPGFSEKRLTEKRRRKGSERLGEAISIGVALNSLRGNNSE